MSRIFTWREPFLASLHAWSSMLAQRHCLQDAGFGSSFTDVLAILAEEGTSSGPGTPQDTANYGSFFARMPARGQLNRIRGLAGKNGSLQVASWFCLVLSPLTPCDCSSIWFVVVGIGKCRAPRDLPGLRGVCLAHFAAGLVLSAIMTAGTDNRSNPQATTKFSMKWPLIGILMQFSAGR